MGRMEQNFPVYAPEWKTISRTSCAWNFSGTSKLNRKYSSSQNTDPSTRRLFIAHDSRDFTETTTAAKTSQNKGFNERYNASARVINLCTFLSQPMQNKQVHRGGTIFVGIKRFLDEFISW